MRRAIFELRLIPKAGRSVIPQTQLSAGLPERLRPLVPVVLLLLVCGCGAVRQAVESESATVTISLGDALQSCTNLYPDQIAMAVARADCIIKATTELVRPSLPFPDLLDQENALRKSLAEQVQAGKVSLLERNIQLHKMHAGFVGQEQERLKANPGMEASKEAAAIQWRLSNPDSCGRLGGNGANCY
jgi:hypothetical protein